MDKISNIKNLLAQDPPAVHGTGTYGISEKVIEAIGKFVAPGACTAETGAGISTLIITALGAKHLAITPTKEEAERIRTWLTKNSLSTDTLAFDHRCSWDALPSMPAATLDFAFIDGCHGFPAPFIDFFYLCRGLKVGGILAIDDVQIWTGKVLVDFLKAEPTWEFLVQLDKTVFLRKLGELEWYEWEWDKQPFVAGNSRPSAGARLFKLLDYARRALKHLFTGDWGKLKKGLDLTLKAGNKHD